MENILRGLIYDGEVSLTLLDVTDIVGEAIRIHVLSPSAAAVIGKTLAAATYMSACLKEETGKVSVSVRGNGGPGNITVSGDYALHMRCCADNPGAEDAEKGLGTQGTLTVIRDDGYSRPFVGACELVSSGDADAAFGEYYRVSEQLPTYIGTDVRLKADGGCAFAGGVVLQPLPFASEETLKKLPDGEALKKIAAEISVLGLKKTAEIYFSAKTAEFIGRRAEYRCNCSREYLSGVVISLGRAQAEEILREDGEIGIHCHYCNKDYRFTKEDVEEMFSR